ncbi:MAG TPA: class I SAM-dependent methyltransferase [Gemmatimonadaceae bacterium]|nr:class I SAM-dependent methyltransferase [Gemmatimonadaceae bacterium]
MDPKKHWEKIYQTKDVHTVSWFQSEAAESLDLITRFVPDRSAPIIDVGGGASVLVDDLLESGYSDLTVLDIAESALEISRQRLGRDAAKVKWIAADARDAPLGELAYVVWHDRAVFHFLTDAADRQSYVAQVLRAVRPGGYVLIATFAEDGPATCSGLPVVRYSAESLHSEFGSAFRVVTSAHEDHHTPAGREQAFLYCLCRRE